MGKKNIGLIALIIAFLLIGFNVFAADGDLIVNGNVGVGTLTPNNKLEVNVGDTANNGIVISNIFNWRLVLATNTGNGSYNPLTGSGDLVLSYNAGAIDTGSIVIGQWSNQPRGIRIDSSGNVGVGIANPSQKLDVSGQIHAAGDICTDAAGGKCLSNLIIPCDWSGWRKSYEGIYCDYGCVQFGPAFSLYCSNGRVTNTRSESACIRCY